MEYKLFQEILKLSIEKNDFNTAKQEWIVADVWYADEEDGFSSCLCGHYPIKEHCAIHNKFTGKSAIVGNCCVKKFLKLDTDDLFKNYKKIKKNMNKLVDDKFIIFLNKKQILNSWEVGFYNSLKNYKSKKYFSFKQLQILNSINTKIKSYMERKH